MQPKRKEEGVIEWPPPREDPDEEPSHPGARLEDLEREEPDRGADA